MRVTIKIPLEGPYDKTACLGNLLLYLAEKAPKYTIVKCKVTDTVCKVRILASKKHFDELNEDKKLMENSRFIQAV